MIIGPAQPEHAEWLRQRTNYRLGGEWRGIVACAATGSVRGMVAYDGWTENAVQMHVAANSIAAIRALLLPAFAYPFEDIGIGVALGLTPANNKRALTLAAGLGFKPVHRIQDGWADGVDLILSELRREDCRWLAKPHRANACFLGSSDIQAGGH